MTAARDGTIEMGGRESLPRELSPTLGWPGYTVGISQGLAGGDLQQSMGPLIYHRIMDFFTGPGVKFSYSFFSSPEPKAHKGSL